VPRPAPVDERASRDAKPGADCYPNTKSGAALPHDADNRTQGSTKREADPAECGDRGHPVSLLQARLAATRRPLPRATRQRFALALRAAMTSALAGSASSVGWRSATICWRRSKLARMSRIGAVDESASTPQTLARHARQPSPGSGHGGPPARTGDRRLPQVKVSAVDHGRHLAQANSTAWRKETVSHGSPVG
jgi:hypothetical protein